VMVLRPVAPVVSVEICRVTIDPKSSVAIAIFCLCYYKIGSLNAR
jgi:hypothetical protein